MKEELATQVNGYLEAVKKHNETFGRYEGVTPINVVSVSFEGFAQYLNTGRVHELSDKELKAEAKQADVRHEKAEQAYERDMKLAEEQGTIQPTEPVA